jgi:hypothetical protein
MGLVYEYDNAFEYCRVLKRPYRSEYTNTFCTESGIVWPFIVEGPGVKMQFT